MILRFSTHLISMVVLVVVMAETAFAQIVSEPAFTQESAKEEDFFKIMRVPSPEGAILEVGGLATLPNGELAVATRRGDVFIIENPTSLRPYYRKFASGLHEVLGLVYKDGALYASQRGELTKLEDTNMDGTADVFETLYAWPISGNYCEYNYLKLAPDGSFYVSCNLAFPEDIWWRPHSPVKWRGWTLHISEDGKMQPWATGMRSPAGLGMVDGELFYADNQGDWIGSGGIVHLKKGAFTGNPAGLVWSDLPESPVNLSQEQLFTKVDPQFKEDKFGRDIKPENSDKKDFVTLFEVKESFPEVQLPAVWLPHGILGISNSEMVVIPKGFFGPFEGQLLIGDQGQSKIMRVFMEKVAGEYQGVAWDFRSGFQSGILRLSWANDGSLFLGQTNRGWGSAGEATEGLQRLVYNNRVPFEMLTVSARPDGFEVAFTKPVDKKSAEDIASFEVESFIYKYHSVYGSPPVNVEKCTVKGVKVSEDGMTVRFIVDNLRKNYIHKISLHGLRDKANSFSLVHPTAYYTLNNIPTGQALPLGETSIYNSAEDVPVTPKPADHKKYASGNKDEIAEKTSVIASAPNFEQVKPLLQKNTCLSCHSTDKRQVGPAFADVAKRNYTNAQIVDLIYNPKPENWPDYASPMPPMPHVPKEEALKIAAWINSLK